MGLLEDYEQQYSVLTAEITSNIGRLGIVSIDDRRDLIVEINRGLDESQELLEQIGLEINENPDVSAKASQKTRLNCYQAELKRLEEDYNKSKIKPTHGGFGQDDSSLDDFDLGMQEDQKKRLLDNSERLERTGNHLQDGYRIAIETEQIGAAVLSNLASQRESIHKSRNRLRETNADLGRSSRLLNTMIMRVHRDKFILSAVGVMFALVISLSIYFSLST